MSIMMEALKKAGLVDEQQIKEIQTQAEEERRQREQALKEARVTAGELSRELARRKTEHVKAETVFNECVPKAERYIGMGVRVAYWQDIVRQHATTYEKTKEAFEQKSDELATVMQRIEDLGGGNSFAK